MIRQWVFLLPALALAAPSASFAAHFDFIVADQITMRAPLASWGITLAGSDFGLIVNKGATSIGAADLDAAEFHVLGNPPPGDSTTTWPNPTLRPELNPGYYFHPSFQPIAPNVAAGSVGPLSGILPTLLLPGETLQDTSPNQFIYFELHGEQTAPGIVRFDVSLLIGDEIAMFPMFVALIDQATYDIEFTHASRVSSVPLATATTTMTWGRVKRLYR